MLKDLYAARCIIDQAAEITKEDSLYEANSHLDEIAKLLTSLMQ